MPFFIFFGRTLIAGTDAEYYEINEYYARLRSWITTEVHIFYWKSCLVLLVDSLIYLLPSSRIKLQSCRLWKRLLKQLEEDNLMCERDKGSGSGHLIQHFSVIGEDFKVTNLGSGSQGDFYICGRCGGTHGFAWHKFKCNKYGDKGHAIRDCKKDRICFHCHQSGHLKPDYPAWVTKGV